MDNPRPDDAFGRLAELVASNERLFAEQRQILRQIETLEADAASPTVEGLQLRKDVLARAEVRRGEILAQLRQNRLDAREFLAPEIIPMSEPEPRPKQHKLTAEQQALTERYIPLARSLARPFKMSWPTHRDDFESAAMMALVESAGTFELDRNVKFSTFARHRIWGSLRDVQRSLVALGYRCDPKFAPLITSLPKDPEGKGRVLGGDSLPQPGEEGEAVEAVEAMLKPLPERHRQACRQVYLHGKTQYAGAKALGCSQSRFSCIHREAIAMLAGTG